MRYYTRTLPPAVSLVRESAPPGHFEQLFRVGVQSLGRVFHPTVVSGGPFGQVRSALPQDGSALTLQCLGLGCT